MRIDSHRPALLTAKEIDDLYGLPHFTEADRHHYFTLSVPERAAVEAHTTSVAVHLTLQLGYFKTKWQLFSYEQDAVSDDLRYILDAVFSRQGVGRHSATIEADTPGLAADRPEAL